MASQTLAFISKARSNGMKDYQIWNELRKDPDFNASTKRARASGFTQDQIAQELGLKVKFIDSKSKSNYQPFDNTKEARQKREQEALKKQGPTQLWESALLGAADIGIPFVQAAQYTKDKINQGINAVADTKLPTNSYEGVTKTYKNINNAHNTVRKANNQGMDVGRIGANMVMTAPLAAAGGTLKAGVPLASKAGAEFLARNAAVGGLIGATGVHENNTERLKSMGAGAVGGALGGIAGDKIGKGIAKVSQKVVPSAKATAQARVSATVDDQIEIALKQSNIKMSDLSDDVVAGLRKDVAAALKSGKAVNKEAIARKVVLDRVGIRPTQAQLTGDPKLWQKQAELAKINGAGDPLRDKLVQDNVQLAGLLDDVAAKTGGKADDAYGAASGAVDALEGQQAQNKAFIGAAYDNARKAAGNDVVLDGRGFANDAITKLDEQYAMSSLPSGVSKIIKDIEKNPQAFTLGKSEELIKILNREYGSSLQNGQPTSSTYAIGVVRDALETRQNEAMQNLLSTGGNDAAQAYQFARDAYKFNAQQIESIPLLKDAIKGVEPDKLFQKHVLNGNVAELQKTVELLNNVNPQSVADIKSQVVKFISGKAVNQNGQFSPAGMKRALDSIGDRRLAAMFTPDEVARLKDIGMAGQYLVTQPAHSYVNNSNTSAALMNFLGGIINRPGFRVALSPFKDVADSVQVRRAMKANIAGDAKASADVINNVMFGEGDKRMIEQLTKLGVIGGANTTKQ